MLSRSWIGFVLAALTALALCVRAGPDRGARSTAAPAVGRADSGFTETANDMPFEESLGRREFTSNAPFEGPSTNAAIGIGPSTGKRALRRLPPLVSP